MPDLQKQVEETLAFFLQEAPQIQAVALVDSRETQRLVAAWPMVGHEWQSPGRRPTMSDPAALWRWLWDGAAWDHDELIKICGVNQWRAEDLFRQIQGARLILPLGGVQPWVEAIIRHELAERWQFLGDEGDS